MKCAILFTLLFFSSCLSYSQTLQINTDKSKDPAFKCRWVEQILKKDVQARHKEYEAIAREHKLRITVCGMCWKFHKVEKSAIGVVGVSHDWLCPDCKDMYIQRNLWWMHHQLPPIEKEKLPEINKRLENQA